MLQHDEPGKYHAKWKKLDRIIFYVGHTLQTLKYSFTES